VHIISGGLRQAILPLAKYLGCLKAMFTPLIFISTKMAVTVIMIGFAASQNRWQAVIVGTLKAQGSWQ